jgi:hypothetical protein
MNLTALGAQETRMSIGDKRGSDMSLAGRVLNEITPSHLNAYHGSEQCPIQRHVNSLAFLNMLWASRHRMHELEMICERREKSKGIIDEYPDFVLAAKTHELSSTELFDLIDSYHPLHLRVWRDTIHYSAQSGVWSTLIMKILAGNDEWRIVHFQDMAMLLAKCDNVKSAEIATSLLQLSELINIEFKVSNAPNTFLEMNIDCAIEWLFDAKRSKEIRETVKRFVLYHKKISKI